MIVWFILPKMKITSVTIAQNGRASWIIHKALARDIQITEILSGPPITKEERHFAEIVEEICHLFAFPSTKYIDTARFWRRKIALHTPYSILDSANGKLCPFYFEILQSTTFLV